MYDIDLKNVKKGKNIFYFFLAVGIIFAIAMVGIFVSTVAKKNSLNSSVLSTSVDVGEYIDDDDNLMYRPTYTYEVKGRQYKCQSDVSSSINPGTENKPVYYDAKDPSRCMTEFSNKVNLILLPFLIIPAIFIVVGVICIMKVNKRVKAIQELNTKGKLIKNLPYHMEDTGTEINGVPLQRPVVYYTLPSGTTITLRGDARNDRKTADSDGMVDVVIDESNPDNYYIDFEINRLTGNLPQDYSIQTPPEDLPQMSYNPAMANQQILNVDSQNPQPQNNPYNQQ